MSQTVETVRICVDLPHKFIVINKSDLKPTDVLYGDIEHVITDVEISELDVDVVTDASEERIKRSYTKKSKG